MPKGIFRYRSHEEANADWERWNAELVAETQVGTDMLLQVLDLEGLLLTKQGIRSKDIADREILLQALNQLRQGGK